MESTAPGANQNGDPGLGLHHLSKNRITGYLSSRGRDCRYIPADIPTDTPGDTPVCTDPCCRSSSCSHDQHCGNCHLALDGSCVRCGDHWNHHSDRPDSQTDEL